jgi:hypothetical protein
MGHRSPHSTTYSLEVHLKRGSLGEMQVEITDERRQLDKVRGRHMHTQKNLERKIG